MATIVVTATIDCDPARRDQVLRDAQPLIEAALAERGCRAYTWSLDLMNPGRIHVFEEWADEAALEAHFHAPPYTDMRKALGTAGITKSVSAKYRVDAIAPVYNSQGVANVDF